MTGGQAAPEKPSLQKATCKDCHKSEHTEIALDAARAAVWEEAASIADDWSKACGGMYAMEVALHIRDDIRGRARAAQEGRK